jgi:hypothetical protein
VCVTAGLGGGSADGIHQIVIRNLSGFRYTCQQLAYFVLSRIFLMVKLWSGQEYLSKSVGKQGEEFIIAAPEKS